MTMNEKIIERAKEKTLEMIQEEAMGMATTKSSVELRKHHENITILFNDLKMLEVDSRQMRFDLPTPGMRQ